MQGENIGSCEINSMAQYMVIYLESPEQAERILMALSRSSGHLATGFNRNRMATAGEVSSAVKSTVSVG